MKVTETKYIEESGYFRIKVDIETEKQKVIGFKILTHSKKIECELEKGKIKTLKSDLIDYEEKQTLLRDEYWYVNETANRPINERPQVLNEFVNLL